MCIEFEISRDFTLQALSTCRHGELQIVAQIEGAKPKAFSWAIGGITGFAAKFRPGKSNLLLSHLEQWMASYFLVSCFLVALHMSHSSIMSITRFRVKRVILKKRPTMVSRIRRCLTLGVTSGRLVISFRRPHACVAVAMFFPREVFKTPICVLICGTLLTSV